MSPPDLETAHDVAAILAETLPSRLPIWLESRRWYADKGRVVAHVSLEDVLADRIGADWVALMIARLAFADGGETRYFLPLAIVPSPASDQAIAALATTYGPAAVVDAAGTPGFGDWFLARMGANEPAPADRWHFTHGAAAQKALRLAGDVDATVSAAEQSNTSLRFGDVLMLKLVRRLQPGPNPDEEALRALAGVGFDHVPRYIASASWRSQRGVDLPIALAQAYVPNVGDAWSWTLARLESLATSAASADVEALAPERLLGRRTGDLHAALARIAALDFAPEAASLESVASGGARTRAALAAAADLIADRAPDLPPSLREALPDVIQRLERLGERVTGYRFELGTWRIRVHGDYHLGQTLRTPDDDWMIIDFEGEPARPVAERRAKTSVLKDVSGMLRSFAYARAVAERELAGDAAAQPRLMQWEQGARRAFLEGYRDALKASPVRLIPADPEAFASALAAWELDKALYEIAYEARNRPDWLAVPLRALLPRIDPQPA
jgi:trehalose synthase-fused probable maltokinase